MIHKVLDDHKEGVPPTDPNIGYDVTRLPSPTLFSGTYLVTDGNLRLFVRFADTPGAPGPTEEVYITILIDRLTQWEGTYRQCAESDAAKVYLLAALDQLRAMAVRLEEGGSSLSLSDSDVPYPPVASAGRVNVTSTQVFVDVSPVMDRGTLASYRSPWQDLLDRLQLLSPAPTTAELAALAVIPDSNRAADGYNELLAVLMGYGPDPYPQSASI